MCGGWSVERSGVVSGTYVFLCIRGVEESTRVTFRASVLEEETARFGAKRFVTVRRRWGGAGSRSGSGFRRRSRSSGFVVRNFRVRRFGLSFCLSIIE